MEQQQYEPKYMRQLRDDAVQKAVYGMLDYPAAEIEIVRGDSNTKTGLTREEIRASLDEFVQGSEDGIKQALGGETRIILRQPYGKQYRDTFEVCFSERCGIYFIIDGRVRDGMFPKALASFYFLTLVRELGCTLSEFKAAYQKQFQAEPERAPDSRPSDPVIEQLRGIPTDGSYEPPNIDWNPVHRGRRPMRLDDMLEEQQAIGRENLRDIKERQGRHRKDYRGMKNRGMKKINSSGRGR